MPNQYITLKDMTALNGGDDAVGLVENIVNVAPELDRIMGRPISGISTRASVLTAVGSNGAFRKIGGGVRLSAPSFDRKRFNCFPFDIQMEIGEDLLIEMKGDEKPVDIFTAHLTAAARQKALRIGKQFYLGSANDPEGPPGLIDYLAISRTQIDSRTGLKIDQVVDAGGSAAGKCEIAWFIMDGAQGVHWIFGNGRGITVNPWSRQRTASLDSTANDPKYRTSWVSNTFGYLGLEMADYHAVGAIINIDNTIKADGTYTKPLTDALVAQLFAKFPITKKATMCLCTQNTCAGLQLSRTVTNFVNSGGREWTSGAAPLADFPTMLPTYRNIPLVQTDSIIQSNQVVVS